MPEYSTLAIDNPDELRFGVAPKPLTTRSGLVIGGGLVYPELNFTLPPMSVEASTMPKVLQHYREMMSQAAARAVELHAPGLVVEFETLPPMTQNPHWAVDVTRVLVDVLDGVLARDGLRSALRVTPNDNREMSRPPRMRSGRHWERMIQTFEGCAAAGAEFLSIESVGGKEVCDEALTLCDIGGVIFGLCVLGVRDMRFLWKQIDDIATRHGARAAGDTACGFGNTAMVLAEKKMIPRVFAAVVRAVTAVRSLVAYECGAVGPGKDCGYENPILKAITGFPMAMEGKTAACAHLSPVGNIAAAACDTWSNESVQDVRLLSGPAPVCSLEQLVYDCRLMNAALQDGPEAALMLRKWMIESDASLDPQAFILRPECAVAVARAIVDATDYYQAGRAAARIAVDLITDAFRDRQLALPDREVAWLDRTRDALDSLPDKETDFINEMLIGADTTRFLPSEYEL